MCLLTVFVKTPHFQSYAFHWLYLSYVWLRHQQKHSWALGLMCVIQHRDNNTCKSDPTKPSVCKTQARWVRSEPPHTEWILPEPSLLTGIWHVVGCGPTVTSSHPTSDSNVTHVFQLTAIWISAHRRDILTHLLSVLVMPSCMLKSATLISLMSLLTTSHVL